MKPSDAQSRLDCVAATTTVARFAIASNVLPRITQAVSVADRFHKTLVTYADKHLLKNTGIFTGLDSEKQPLANHQHTHIFCELGDQRDAIGYITLYAPGGFDDEAQTVIEDVQRSRLWGKGDHDIHLIPLGFGDEQTFLSPLFAKSAKWRSVTPFVSTQHLKTYGDGRPKLDAHGWQQGSAAASLLQQLEKDPRTAGLLKVAGLKKLQSIEVRRGLHLRCFQFQTRRPDGGGQRGNGDCGAFTLEFQQEIQGPLAIGYGSHFGLGLFVPISDT
ncbi:type I-U CRISPR-associated protein Csb2 [Prosthecobacter sp.]|jgi:CRISPR-associated protein Csb2|uniref:type I-G CRISPR-associated protein Csb2 n=1 Tax=Prosthecobacter sp. TaxID=1965333 RepID=UPI0037C8ACBD